MADQEKKSLHLNLKSCLQFSCHQFNLAASPITIIVLIAGWDGVDTSQYRDAMSMFSPKLPLII